MENKRIVLLAGEWDTTHIMYNFLKEHCTVECAIIEKPVNRKEFLKKRIKKLGLLNVSGQILFQLLISKSLSKMSKRRIKEIIKEYNLNPTAIPSDVHYKVPSVNSEECLELLKSQQPDLIIVHGTRIISKKILRGVSCPFINIHAGITPRYRGSHGAYWALTNDDFENCGVTVHLVDQGIDTGNILFQGRIPVSKKDNFVTYPYLQLAEGLLLLKKAVDHFFEGRLVKMNTDYNSALWHHPTLWGYLYNRIFKGIK